MTPCSTAARAPLANRLRYWAIGRFGLYAAALIVAVIRRNNEIVAAIGVGGSPGGDKAEVCAQAGVTKFRNEVNASRSIISAGAGGGFDR